MGTRLEMQDSGCVVRVCLKGCNVDENVVESRMKPCAVEFVRECCGWVHEYD